MANARSPNYPAFGLPEAIERVRKVYDREHTHKAAKEVVAKALGYQGMNGKSLTVLSTLKKYALLEEVGADLKISADALTILVEQHDSLERADAIRRAAYNPALFDDIRKQYGETIPSDDNLRSFLLRKGFLQGAVDAPIRAYRETVGLVNSLPKADNELSDIEEGNSNVELPAIQARGTAEQSHRITPNPASMNMGAASPLLNGKQVGSAIPVSPNCSMTVLADGEVTQEGLQRLIEYITLIKTWFPTQSDTLM